MKAGAGSLAESLLEDRVGRQFAILYCFVDPGEVLIDDAARSEIQMTDLRISHLTAGEADVRTTGTQATAGIGLIEKIVERRFPQQGGIPIGLGLLTSVRIDSPPVPNN